MSGGLRIPAAKLGRGALFAPRLISAHLVDKVFSVVELGVLHLCCMEPPRAERERRKTAVLYATMLQAGSSPPRLGENANFLILR